MMHLSLHQIFSMGWKIGQQFHAAKLTIYQGIEIYSMYIAVLILIYGN